LDFFSLKTVIREINKMPEEKAEKKPGECIPWEEKIKEYEKITGDMELVKRVWEDIDSMAYIYIWFCLIAA
jgi:hypothetical protein